MHILLAAATEMEIHITRTYLSAKIGSSGSGQFEILITGVGSVALTYALSAKICSSRPDLVICAGIAGSFMEKLALGEVIQVNEEVFGDLGVEEKGNFRDHFDLALGDENAFPFSNKILINKTVFKSFPDLKPVKGVTINEITTHPVRIDQLKKKYAPDIESMEGAAFHYVCIMENLPFIHLRAISNYVGERDKTKWKIEEAIRNLNEQIIQITDAVETNNMSFRLK